jgi:RNA polymerase sigma-70 factor (ECF subfamily)
LIYLKLKTGNDSVAEELCSDIFLKIYNNLNTYDPTKARLSSWICQITNNHLIDHYRKDSRRLVFDNLDNSVVLNGGGEDDYIPDSVIDYHTPEKKMISDEIFDKVMGLINNLTGIKQKIATLFFIDQYKYQDICNELDLPLGTVKGMIFRVREILQEQVKASCTYESKYW